MFRLWNGDTAGEVVMGLKLGTRGMLAFMVSNVLLTSKLLLIKGLAHVSGTGK